MQKKITKKSKRRLMIFGIPALLIILYFCVTVISYIYNYSKLKDEEEQLKHELVVLQKEKQDLKVEIKKLNDPDYIVRYAKEKFLYSTDGEYVIKIIEEEEQQVVSEEDNSYFMYGILGSSALVLCFIFLKKKK